MNLQKEVLWFYPPLDCSGDGLKVIGIGYPDHMEPNINDCVNGTADYLFMFFPMPMLILYDGKRTMYPANTFVLWEPFHRWSFGRRDTDWTHSWIHCCGPFVEELVRHAKIPLNQPVQLPDASAPEEYLCRMFVELKQQNPPDYTILKSLLALYVRTVDRQIHPQGPQPMRPECVLKGIDYISGHIGEKLSLKKISGAVHISPSHFSAEFQKSMGIAPMAFVREQRLQRSARLLGDRSFNIAEIAEQTGFQDPFYFSRRFQKRFGLAPSKYRNASPEEGSSAEKRSEKES